MGPKRTKKGAAKRPASQEEKVEERPRNAMAEVCNKMAALLEDLQNWVKVLEKGQGSAPKAEGAPRPPKMAKMSGFDGDEGVEPPGMSGEGDPCRHKMAADVARPPAPSLQSLWSPTPTSSHIANPAAIDPLGSHLPLSTKAKIWCGEYMDLFSLLFRDPGKGDAVERNFVNWLVGYAIYAGVVLEAQLERALALLTYQDAILWVHLEYIETGWLHYDEAFRRHAAAAPSLWWDVPHDELWLACFAGVNRAEGYHADSGHLVRSTDRDSDAGDRSVPRRSAISSTPRAGATESHVGFNTSAPCATEDMHVSRVQKKKRRSGGRRRRRKGVRFGGKMAVDPLGARTAESGIWIKGGCCTFKSHHQWELETSGRARKGRGTSLFIGTAQQGQSFFQRIRKCLANYKSQIPHPAVLWSGVGCFQPPNILGPCRNSPPPRFAYRIQDGVFFASIALAWELQCSRCGWTANPIDPKRRDFQP